MSTSELHSLLDRLADEAEKVGCRPRDFQRPAPPYERDFVLAWTSNYGHKIPGNAVDWFTWWGGFLPTTSVLSPYQIVPYGAGWSLDQDHPLPADDNKPVPYWPDLEDRLVVLGDEPRSQIHLNLSAGQVFQYNLDAFGPEGFAMVSNSLTEYVELHLRLYERGCIRKVEHQLFYQQPTDGRSIDYPAALDHCDAGSPGKPIPPNWL